MFSRDSRMEIVPLLLFLGVFGAFGFAVDGNAQDGEDSVQLGVNYQYQSFYQLSFGERKQVTIQSWDLAFDVRGFGYTVRINDGAGSELYRYPYGDTSAWNSIDTAGIATWSPLYNSDTSWSVGAFNRYQKDLDVGWGNYNPVTHQIIGDSLYILKTTSGAWKKVWIQKLANGVYTFRYANLDGTDDRVATVQKGEFQGQNFAYYSLQEHRVVAVEPLSNQWDIVFTRYRTEIAAGIFYPVVGVLLNPGVEAAKAYPVENPLEYSDYSAHPFSTKINVIGYDWKIYDPNMGRYHVRDSLCYFVKDREGKIWRIVFLDFEGSTTGKVRFRKTLLSPLSASVEQKSPLSVALYPNPAENWISLVLNTPMSLGEGVFRLFDLSGKRVKQEKLPAVGFRVISFSLDDVFPGTYIAEFQFGSVIFRRILTINK